MPLNVEIVASGLGFPSSFAFTPDGRMLVTSLAGNIVWSVKPNVNQTLVEKQPFYQFPPGTFPPVEGAGPLGIAVDPDYKTTKLVFVFLAMANSGNTTHVQIVSLKDVDGAGTDANVIFTSNSYSNFETGGMLKFGPDRMLWLTIGHQLGTPEDLANVQDWSSHTGKIIRLKKDGTPAPGNPHPLGIYAKGVRNSFAGAFDPKSKPQNFWVGEPGPDCNDEINLVTKGANFGWGIHATCNVTKAKPAPWNTNQDGTKISLPKAFFTIDPPKWGTDRPPTPTGMVVCNKCKLPTYEGRLFVGTFHAGRILTFKFLGKKRTGLAAPEISYVNYIPIIGVDRSPDGAIYFCDAAGFIKRLVIDK